MKKIPFPVRSVKVSLDFGLKSMNVGTLALRDGRIYFEFDPDFLRTGLEISPIRLALQAGLFTLDTPFEGLAGVFNDSLPDGWGRLLVDRAMRHQGILQGQVSPLDRLVYVGTQGMGALCYQPDYSGIESSQQLDLDQLFKQTQTVLAGDASMVLAELLSLNGSSAGARPKAMIAVDEQKLTVVHGKDVPPGFQHWLVKFPNSFDGPDAGAIEYAYSLLAKHAGLSMSETHLFPSRTGAGFFASNRFDRSENARRHMHSVCGLLHSDFRSPVLDYADLLKVTEILTKRMPDVEMMFRYAVFNVLSHNRDDHGKNFSFLMDHSGEWRLAPAYDVTFSAGPMGQQSMMVMGEGTTPSSQDLIELGQAHDLAHGFVIDVLEQTRDALTAWPKMALDLGVKKETVTQIAKHHQV